MQTQIVIEPILLNNQICILCSVVGDGRRGYRESAPYDAIHVGAAADEVPQEVRCTRMVCVYVLCVHRYSCLVCSACM